MWFIYIIYSEKIDGYYTGITDDPEWRLFRHNDGWGKYTKRGIPWKMVYTESLPTKSEALKREREIKRKKSKRFIESLITNSAESCSARERKVSSGSPNVR